MAKYKLRDIISWRFGWAIGFRNGLDSCDEFLIKNLKELNDGEPWRKGERSGEKQSCLEGNKLDRYCEVGPAKPTTDCDIAWRLGWFSAYSKGRCDEIKERTKGHRRGGHGSTPGDRDARDYLCREIHRLTQVEHSKGLSGVGSP